jgi:hypothetical protein
MIMISKGAYCFRRVPRRASGPADTEHCEAWSTAGGWQGPGCQCQCPARPAAVSDPACVETRRRPGRGPAGTRRRDCKVRCTFLRLRQVLVVAVGRSHNTVRLRTRPVTATHGILRVYRYAGYGRTGWPFVGRRCLQLQKFSEL